MKEKEIKMKNFLNEMEIKYVHDQIVEQGCSKKRPDFQIKTYWGTIILEVDEHQHNRKTYSCECEITRMKQIYYDVGEEKMIFIRFNPDTYKSETKKLSINQRYEYMEKFIQEKINQIPQYNLSVIYLFYDFFDISIPEYEKIEVV
jgi:hypothetical protein